MLQEAIVGRITDGRNLFMVGDVKQSIYTSSGWQEPEIFRRNISCTHGSQRKTV